MCIMYSCTCTYVAYVFHWISFEFRSEATIMNTALVDGSNIFSKRAEYISILGVHISSGANGGCINVLPIPNTSLSCSLSNQLILYWGRTFLFF